MRRLVVLALAAALTPPLGAKVWITAYRCDEITPLAAIDPNHPTVYRDIMVGARLALVVSSDAGGYWQGRLLISHDEQEYATLSGRGYVSTRPGTTTFYPNYAGSCLDAAGGKARVRFFDEFNGTGFDFSTTVTGASTGTPPAVAGDWFIIDYRAEQIGTCSIRLYDPSVSLDMPLQTLSFTHVPSRDFNGDALVDFQDFALLALHQDASVPADPKGPDSAFDLNGDARVDLGDLALFSEYWLERTDCTQLATDPNNLPAGHP